MRTLVLLGGAALLGLQAWFAFDTAAASGRVAGEALEIADLGDDEATRMALAAPLDLYPFAPASFTARLRLAQTEGGLAGRAQRAGPLPLRDGLLTNHGAPWVAPGGVALAAALALLAGLLGRQSRVRLLSALLLLLLLGATALAQGWLPSPAAPGGDGWQAVVTSQLEALAFAAFPALALAGLLLAWLLALLPRRAD